MLHARAYIGLLAVAALPAIAADPAKIQWGKIRPTTVTLFYPGQSSYQWLRKDGHPGAEAVKAGEACTTCHQGSEKAQGDKIVKGGPLEPMPVKGKNGWIDLRVQAAYDANNLYLRYQWKTLNAYPGTEHQYLRFDGAEWKVFGYPKLDKVVQERKQPAFYEDRMTVMIDDGKVPGFAQQGCWLTCHDGQRDMAGAASAADARANALLGALKKNDVRKYLPATRTDPLDWRSGRSLESVAQLKREGAFVDLIQWRAHRSNAVGMADDGYVLEFRNADAGRDVFASNVDPKTRLPKYMWDARKTGFRAISVAEVRKAPHFLVREENAVPFDPNAGWKEGDLIPDYVVSREDGRGSAVDNRATSQWKDGVWTVVLVRPLGLTNDDDKTLREGGVYNVGFAVHDDNITTRGHHVSFVKTLGIGAKADITATRLR